MSTQNCTFMPSCGRSILQNSSHRTGENGDRGPPIPPPPSARLRSLLCAHRETAEGKRPLPAQRQKSPLSHPVFCPSYSHSSCSGMQRLASFYSSSWSSAVGWAETRCAGYVYESPGEGGKRASVWGARAGGAACSVYPLLPLVQSISCTLSLQPEDNKICHSCLLFVRMSANLWHGWQQGREEG